MRRETVLELSAMVLACLIGWAAFSIIDAPPMTRAEVADWAQGIGSIAAVGVAALVGTIPLRVSRLERVARRSSFIAAVLDASEKAMGGAEELIAAAFDEDVITAQTSSGSLRTGRNQLALRKLLEEPVSSWPSVDMYVAAFELDDLIGQLGFLEYSNFNTPEEEISFSKPRLISRRIHLEHLNLQAAAAVAELRAW